MNWFMRLLVFLREVLSEDGQGSWSRVGSTIVVDASVYVILSTRGIPERTEELAWVLAALYGANQLGRLGQGFASERQQKMYASPNRDEP